MWTHFTQCSNPFIAALSAFSFIGQNIIFQSVQFNYKFPNLTFYSRHVEIGPFKREQCLLQVTFVNFKVAPASQTRGSKLFKKILEWSIFMILLWGYSEPFFIYFKGFITSPWSQRFIGVTKGMLLSYMFPRCVCMYVQRILVIYCFWTA